MATDPVEQIQSEMSDSPLSFGVQGALRRLAELPASPELPYLTLSLDWRPAGEHPGWDLPEELEKSQRRHDAQQEEGMNRRPSWRTLERELDDEIEKHGPRGDVFDSLSADKERIEIWLDQELDPSAQGVFIVACSALDVFEPLSLSLPVDSRLDIGPTPALSVLARMADDHPAHAVLLADQQDATLTIVRRAQQGRQITVDGDDYPRKQQQGGWLQRRYQARADERVAAFAREVAEQTRTALREEEDVHALIIAGDEVITSALDDVMHSEVSDAVIDRIRLDIETSDREMIEATLPVAEQAERNRELQVAKDVTDAVGAGVKGAAGASDVLTASQAGQVMTLVMVDDFTGTGWADFELDLFGSGDIPVTHAMGGQVENIVSMKIEEELIRLALRTDAEIDIIKTSVPVSESEGVPDADEALPRTDAALLLDKLGGVAALLRFDLDSAAETSGEPGLS